MSVVVSLLERDVEALVRAARAAAASSAEAVELRLDHLSARDIDALRDVVGELRARGMPVLAAVHGAEGFGTFSGSLDERFELLRAAARAGARFVDVDARFAAAFGAPPPGVTRIVSHHETDGTPGDVSALFARIDALARPDDLVKVVTHARCAEDGLRVLAALRASTRERTAFCSGERGAFTRVLAPLCGSRFTYAASGARRASAPGQLASELLAPQLAGRTRAARWFAVLGRPVAHSWSPRLHGAVFRELGLDAVYVACEPDDAVRFLELARELPFDGFSVTAPFKADVLRACAHVDAASATSGGIGAANTLVRRSDGWHASNTDAPAIVGALQMALGARALADCSALVVGAGGAARAAVWSLRAAKARVCVFARSFEKARALCAELGGEPLEAREVATRRFDVLVHTTPAGSLANAASTSSAERSVGALDFEPEGSRASITERSSAIDRGASSASCAVPREWIAPGSIVLDAVYRPRATELLRRARENGALALPGSEWFLRQAAAQAVFFTRRDDAEPILRAELERLCAEDDAASAGSRAGEALEERGTTSIAREGGA